jgi:hypothetical protein
MEELKIENIQQSLYLVKFVGPTYTWPFIIYLYKTMQKKSTWLYTYACIYN